MKAFVGAFLEASLQDALPGRSGQHTRRRDVGRILLEDRRHRFGGGVALERAASGEHLVEDAAQREDVGAMIAALPANLLGRHVTDRAEHDARFGRGRNRGRVRRRERVRGLPRQTEIEDLDRAVAADEHVVRLQIAMRDMLVMRGRQAAGYLGGDGDRLPRRQPGGEPGTHRLTLEQLHDRIADAVAPADVVKGQDVWMGQHRDRSRFALEAGERFGIRGDGLGTILTATSRPSRLSCAR